MTTDRRFTVFACPASDGRTPEFNVMDGGVRVSQTFTTKAAAQADADRREAEVMFPSPHAALTATYTPANYFENEDESVVISFNGEEVASVQIMRASFYGGFDDRFAAGAMIDSDTFQHGAERATYEEAAADAVAIIREHNLAALDDASVVDPFANTKGQFPAYPAADLPEMPEGFEDASWHNDSSPSIENRALGLRVWIDFLKPEDRDLPETERFTVQAIDAEGEALDEGDLLNTDEWADVLALIAARKEA